MLAKSNSLRDSKSISFKKVTGSKDLSKFAAEQKPVYVTQPALPPLDEFIPYLEEIWASRKVTNIGQYHQELESALCQFLGVKYISLFANGTIALLIALQVLRIQGEVITTPYSFVATTHAIQWNGLKPVFADIDENTFHLVITDLKMPQGDGLYVLENVKKIDPQTMVVICTGYGTVNTAVKAMKLGAYEYITKPIKVEEMKLVVQRALDYQRLQTENVLLQKQLKAKYKFKNLVGDIVAQLLSPEIVIKGAFELLSPGAKVVGILSPIITLGGLGQLMQGFPI